MESYSNQRSSLNLISNIDINIDSIENEFYHLYKIFSQDIPLVVVDFNEDYNSLDTDSIFTYDLETLPRNMYYEIIPFEVLKKYFIYFTFITRRLFDSRNCNMEERSSFINKHTSFIKKESFYINENSKISMYYNIFSIDSEIHLLFGFDKNLDKFYYINLLSTQSKLLYEYENDIDIDFQNFQNYISILKLHFKKMDNFNSEWHSYYYISLLYFIILFVFKYNKHSDFTKYRPYILDFYSLYENLFFGDNKKFKNYFNIDIEYSLDDDFFQEICNFSELLLLFVLAYKEIVPSNIYEENIKKYKYLMTYVYIYDFKNINSASLIDKINSSNIYNINKDQRSIYINNNGLNSLNNSFFAKNDIIGKLFVLNRVIPFVSPEINSISSLNKDINLINKDIYFFLDNYNNDILIKYFDSVLLKTDETIQTFDEFEKKYLESEVSFFNDFI